MWTVSFLKTFLSYGLCLSYSEQFLQQHRHYQSNVEIFKLQPDKPNKELAELVMFLAQVGQKAVPVRAADFVVCIKICFLLFRLVSATPSSCLHFQRSCLTCWWITTQFWSQIYGWWDDWTLLLLSSHQLCVAFDMYDWGFSVIDRPSVKRWFF